MSYRWARRDYYSRSDAVEKCGNSKVQNDPLIKAALMQIKIAEAAIDARAFELEQEEDPWDL